MTDGSLHEQHRTLLARGMPQCPDLDYRADEPYGPWFLRSGHCDVDAMPVADETLPRAIITMHALGWCFEVLDMSERADLFYTGKTWGTLFISHPNCQLECILAATAHLGKHTSPA
jgi:hypothetical protein